MFENEKFRNPVKTFKNMEHGTIWLRNVDGKMKHSRCSATDA